MMHRRGKSDLVIVAVKLANKVERSAAELVERRAGAKGNADQQSTSRTLSRTSVIQALGRIPRTALSRGHSPEAGAVCLNWARTDLCGGRPVMDVPTATRAEFSHFDRAAKLAAIPDPMQGVAGGKLLPPTVPNDHQCIGDTDGSPDSEQPATRWNP